MYDVIGSSPKQFGTLTHIAYAFRDHRHEAHEKINSAFGTPAYRCMHFFPVS
jgi:hypothetical protein